MAAWLSKSAMELRESSVEEMIDVLVGRAGRRGFNIQREEILAWRTTLTLVIEAFDEISESADLTHCQVLFEYEIPRRGRRIDVVLILGTRVAVIEMKVGANRFDRAAMLQLVDYIRDLRDFHLESKGIEPDAVLIATDVQSSDVGSSITVEGTCLQCISLASELSSIIADLLGRQVGELVDHVAWNNSEYQPTPGIVEAAVELFAGHDVRAISQAWADNLSETVDAIRRIVSRARSERQRVVALVQQLVAFGELADDLFGGVMPSLHG